MTFRIRCRVSGGITGTRESYVKSMGVEQVFTTQEEAEAAADRARAAVKDHPGPARFAFWVEQST